MFAREYLPGLFSILFLLLAFLSGYVLIVPFDFEYHLLTVLLPGGLSLTGLIVAVVGIKVSRKSSFLAYIGIVVNILLCSLAFSSFLFPSHPCHIKRVNERKVIRELWKLHSAQTFFRLHNMNVFGKDEYAGDFKAIVKIGAVRGEFERGEYKGYKFEISAWNRGLWATPIPAWTAKASPVRPGATGDKYFRTGDNQYIQMSRKDIFQLDGKP
ncbi:MAG: hypothetical protein ACYTHN_10605 [Planctomycetota bacterium]|jgi:hypothetical protein